MTVKPVTSTPVRWPCSPVPCASTTLQCVQCPAGGGLLIRSTGLQEPARLSLTYRPEKPVSAFVFDLFRRKKLNTKASASLVKPLASTPACWLCSSVPSASTTLQCVQCPAGGGLLIRSTAPQESARLPVTYRPEKPVSASVSAFVFGLFRRKKSNTKASASLVKPVMSTPVRWPCSPVPCASTTLQCVQCPAGGGLLIRSTAPQESARLPLTYRPEKPVSDPSAARCFFALSLFFSLSCFLTGVLYFFGWGFAWRQA